MQHPHGQEPSSGTASVLSNVSVTPLGSDTFDGPEFRAQPRTRQVQVFNNIYAIETPRR
jgi:hypothetical protein